MTLHTESLAPGLDVTVYGVSFDSQWGPLNSWVYATRGLQAFGHREVAFAVKVRSNESPEGFPREVFPLLNAVADAARQGKSVDVGDQTVFQPPGPFLGRQDLRCLVYTWIPPMLEELAGADALLAVFLTENERLVANLFGHTRVLALLGASTRFFPTPPWLDRERAEIARVEQMSSSLIGRASRIRLSRSVVFMTTRDTRRKVIGETGGLEDFEGNWSNGPLTLQLEPADLRRLKPLTESLPIGATFGILTSVPHTLSHCMVWNPSGLTLISDYDHREDPRYGGNFLLFVGEQEQNAMNGVEDGFGLLLTDVDLARVRRSLAVGEPLTISNAEGEILLEIEVRQRLDAH